MEWRQKVAEALREVRDYDTGQIAQMFAEAGITGVRHMAGRCPVAQWASRISVENGGPRMFAGSKGHPFLTANDNRSSMLRLPWSLLEFIGLFDDGYFPELAVEELERGSS